MNARNTSDIDTEITMAMFDFDYIGDSRLTVEKVCAIMSLHTVVRTYRKEGFPEESIIRPIVVKKLEFIKEAETKGQLREILAPPKVRYYGGEVHPLGKYTIPEEELIIWSRTSLCCGGPLIAPAFKRYCDLFRAVFPDQAKEIGI